jgi:hypothetical protein
MCKLLFNIMTDAYSGNASRPASIRIIGRYMPYMMPH